MIESVTGYVIKILNYKILLLYFAFYANIIYTSEG